MIPRHERVNASVDRAVKRATTDVEQLRDLGDRLEALRPVVTTFAANEALRESAGVLHTAARDLEGATGPIRHWTPARVGLAEAVLVAPREEVHV